MTNLADLPLRSVNVIDALRYISGQNGESNHNHPCIGAYGRRLLVIARGVRREFRIEEFDKAIEWYRLALEECGYLGDAIHG